MAINASLKYFFALEQYRQALERLLKGYSNDFLNKKPESGGWSVLQILDHVRVAEKQTLKALVKNVGGQQRVVTPVGSYIKLGWVVLLFRLKVKLKAPEYVSAKLPQHLDKKDFFDKWEFERAEWQKFIYNCESTGAIPAFKHPIIGLIEVSMALLFMREHLKRHYGQVLLLIKELENNR